jgi:hypothetical protein
MEVDIAVALGFAIPIIGLAIEHFHYDAIIMERMGRIETKVDLFWGALEKQLPTMLLRGNPIDADSDAAKLLQKFQFGSITPSEIKSLIILLEEEAKISDHTPGEVLAIVMMEALLRAKEVA